MSNRLKLRVELADGCILVGEVISVGSKQQSPDHIVKMGPDPIKMQEFKDPVEVVNHVIELMRVAQNMPLNFLQPRG